MSTVNTRRAPRRSARIPTGRRARAPIRPQTAKHSANETVGSTTWRAAAVGPDAYGRAGTGPDGGRLAAALQACVAAIRGHGHQLPPGGHAYDMSRVVGHGIEPLAAVARRGAQPPGEVPGADARRKRGDMRAHDLAHEQDLE